MRNILIGRSSGNYRNDISAAKITATPASVTYTGNPFAPPVMVELDGIVLKPNDDYSVRYVDNVSVGKGTAVVEGKGMYVGTNSCELTILPVAVANTDLSTAVVTVPQKSYTYSGSAITPEVTVKMNGTNIALGTDYSVTYSDNVDIGTAKITITAVAGGTYQGSQTITFSIVRPDLKNATVTLNAYVFSYTGSLVCPVATVKMMVGQTLLTLTKDVDYELSYVNNGQRGTAQAVVSGIGGYTGSKSVDFQIGKDLSAAVVDLLANTYPYTGAAVDPEPVVTLAGSRLTKGVDYTVSYKDNVNIGLGRVIVTGIGEYIGSVTAPLNIDNSENEAWERIVLGDRMATAVRKISLRNEGAISWEDSWSWDPDVGDLHLISGQPIPGGKFMALATTSGGYYYADVYSRLMMFSFQRGHEFDISNSNGTRYLGNDPDSMSPIRSNSSGKVYDSTGYSSFNSMLSCSIAHYGRKLIVPARYRYRVRDTGGFQPRDGVSYYPVSDESDSGGSVYLNRYGKYIVTCDLDTPYDFTAYGNEKRAAKIPGIGDLDKIFSAQFSSDGSKIIAIVEHNNEYVNMSRFLSITLKSPYKLDSSADIQSVSEVNLEGVIYGSGAPGFRHSFHAVQFSPDGKHMAVCLGGSDMYVVLVHFTTAWDLTTATAGSAISTRLKDTDSAGLSTHGGQSPVFFLFLPKYGKMLLCCQNGVDDSNGRRTYPIWEYTIA